MRERSHLAILFPEDAQPGGPNYLSSFNRVPMRSLLITLILAWPLSVAAQAPRMSEAAAKDAVYRIVQHSGLLPMFTVREDPTVKNANAYIKGRERIIAYNPTFMAGIIDSSRTDWSAVSILAHEIAHHLLGHTLDPEELHPGDELACDRYSGFILFQMGASLPEALAAIAVAGNVHGTRDHPPKHARSAAIQQGWEEAERMSEHRDAIPFKVDVAFQYVVRFAGDDNTYYVDAAGCLVWFNDHAEPIEFGACTRLGDGAFVFALSWEDQEFFVDARNIIWRQSVNGMQMAVGRIEPYTIAK